MNAYKLVRLGKDGNIYPLFIGKKTPFKMNEWMVSECIPTKGFAVRQGFHCCFEMNAPHLKKVLKSGERRVWIRCKVADYTTYDRPESQGGAWILADKMKVVEIIG